METQFKTVLFTNEQVCQILSISKRTLQEWRTRKIITFVQCHRKILYTEQDIQTFLDAHHIKSSIMKGGQ
jgi:hypothetical protein